MWSVSSHIPMLLVGVVNWVNAICKMFLPQKKPIDNGSFRAARLPGQATGGQRSRYEFPHEVISTIDQILPGQCPGVPRSGYTNAHR